MSDIQNIQAELIAAYEALTFPNSLGSPTGYKHEPLNGLDSGDLPAVVVNRGVLISKRPISSDRDSITREYITDVYCYLKDESEPVNATQRNNTSDCIDVIEGAFAIYALTTRGVLFHVMSADTGDVELYARDDTKDYIGVRFRHQVTYIKEK